MDNPFSDNSFTQRKGPRSTRASSSQANASANASAENPFTDPTASSSSSTTDISTSSQRLRRSAPDLSDSRASDGNDSRPGRARYFHSRRVRKDEAIKPWVKEPKERAEKWIEIIPLVGLLIGIIIAGILIWDGLRSVVDHKYCPVLNEDWSHGFRQEIWQPEIQVGGYG